MDPEFLEHLESVADDAAAVSDIDALDTIADYCKLRAHAIDARLRGTIDHAMALEDAADAKIEALRD